MSELRVFKVSKGLLQLSVSQQLLEHGLLCQVLDRKVATLGRSRCFGHVGSLTVQSV